MTVQMMLAVLAMVAFTCDATGDCGTDKDGKSQSHFQFKASLDDRWCETSDRGIEKCGAECCEKQKDLCEDKFKTRGCKTADHYYDPLKQYTTTTDETADVDCCSEKKKCDITCPAGWEKKAAYDTTDCTRSHPNAVTCQDDECCQKIMTCKGFQDRGEACNAGWSYKGNDADAATNGNFNTNCCQEDDHKTCEGWLNKNPAWQCKKADDQFDEHFIPIGSKGTSVADNDEKKWELACCTEKVIKCSEYAQCNSKAGGGWAHDVAKDNTECMLGEGFGSAKWTAMKPANWKEGDALPGSLCSETCCKPDKRKCRGYPAPHQEDRDCSVKFHEYLDLETKADNSVADDEAYRGECCTKKLSCKHWKDGTSEGVAGGTNRQHALVAAPFLVALGILALTN